VSGDVSLEPLLLFLVIFLWTPPHFWALALYRCGDYARAGIPMMPNVAGPESTRRQMLAYTLILWPAAASPWFLGLTGWLYGIVALLLGASFVAVALYVWRARSDAAARRMFGFSILYLFVLFTALIVDAHALPTG